MPSQTKSNNLIVGLDIGTTKICAIAVEGDDIEALNVVGVGTAKSEGLRKGVVVNIEKTQLCDLIMYLFAIGQGASCNL